MNVPFLDLKSLHQVLKPEILPLWEEILESAGFVGGKHVQTFEREFAEACTARECVIVNSGTDALRFIFLALGLQPGDEVITVANTFIATTEAISQSLGKIVLIDVTPGTFTMDPVQIEKAITSKTKGIVPVHLYGQMADMGPILAIAEKHGLWVVEDACQAHLAEYKNHKAGSMGIAGAFSFYPGKNLGACGEAGAITTNNSELAQKITMLRDHGQVRKYYHDMEGYNGRCDALQAAALRVKLRYLTTWNEQRRQNAKIYFEELKDLEGLKLPVVSPDVLPVFHLFVVQVKQREKIEEYLNKKGVATGLHYPIPLHLQNAYSQLNLGEGSFPVTEKQAKESLSLPMFPSLTKEQIIYTCDALKEAVRCC